jgi:hypothetical protein
MDRQGGFGGAERYAIFPGVLVGHDFLSFLARSQTVISNTPGNK